MRGGRGIDAMEMQPIDAHTIADSISAGLPADRIKGLAAVRETDGAYIKVTDDEILAAIPVLARGSGVFAEPAGAAAYAGLVKAVGARSGRSRRAHRRPLHRQRAEGHRLGTQVRRRAVRWSTRPGGRKTRARHVESPVLQSAMAHL